MMRRSYTRSSEKEVLVQLRNSLNPYEKIKTRSDRAGPPPLLRWSAC